MPWSYLRQSWFRQEAGPQAPSGATGAGSLMRRPSPARAFAGLVLLGGVSACLEEADAGPCPSEQSVVHLRGELEMRELAGNKASLAGKADAAKVIWLSVYENESIIRCDSGLISVVNPGFELATIRVGDDGLVDVDIPRTIYLNVSAPSLSLTILIDEDGDGVCNGHELSGQADVAHDGLIGAMHDLEAGCPRRL